MLLFCGANNEIFHHARNCFWCILISFFFQYIYIYIYIYILISFFNTYFFGNSFGVFVYCVLYYLWTRRLAGQLVDPCKPGDFNQALMELGATICTPLKPICSACPVSDQCSVLSMSESHRSILVTDYPVKVVKAKKRHDFSAVSVVKILEEQDISKGSQYNSRFLLVKRPNEGLLAGLWEFPSVLLDGEADGATRRKRIDRFLKSFKLDTKKNCRIVSREDVGECVHVFTHIHLTMYVELLVLHLKGLGLLINSHSQICMSVYVSLYPGVLIYPSMPTYIL